MNYIHLSQVDSTNKYAKELFCGGETLPTLVLADSQSAGRGRLGRGFFSPDGGLYMSILFFPKGCAEAVSLFTPLMALAVSAAILEIFGKETAIKWVNDIYLSGKKLCGILAEAEPTESGVKYAVIGVGLNISVPKGGFDAEIKDIATALFPEGCDATQYREKLGFRIAELFFEYFNTDRAVLLEEYRKKLLYINEKISVNRFGESYTATVLGVDDDFGLIVRDEGGDIRTLHSGEISIRPAEGLL